MMCHQSLCRRLFKSTLSMFSESLWGIPDHLRKLDRSFMWVESESGLDRDHEHRILAGCAVWCLLDSRLIEWLALGRETSRRRSFACGSLGARRSSSVLSVGHRYCRISHPDECEPKVIFPRFAVSVWSRSLLSRSQLETSLWSCMARLGGRRTRRIRRPLSARWPTRRMLRVCVRRAACGDRAGDVRRCVCLLSAGRHRVP
jgi:hypothetical protein